MIVDEENYHPTVKDKNGLHISLPDVYKQHVPNGEGPMSRLLRSLYGLMQAPLLCQAESTTFLKAKGYDPLESDPSLFQHHSHEEILVIFMDDLIIIYNNRDAVNTKREELSSNYELRFPGPINIRWYTGWTRFTKHLVREKDTIWNGWGWDGTKSCNIARTVSPPTNALVAC